MITIMNNTYCYLLLLLSFFLFPSCGEDHLELARNGNSDYEIVLQHPDEATHPAGEVLQHYLKAITSVEIPIVEAAGMASEGPKIFVGVNPQETGSPDGISIQTRGNNLHITGGSAQGLTYAVYEFLEQYLGCAWYAPDAANIPTQDRLTLAPVDYQYTPDITTRTAHSRLFYEDSTFAAQLKVTTESFPYYVPKARVHTFHRFLPEEQFYQAHPEYYALRGDKRLPTQLCLTNPKVLDIVKDSVSALFAQYPDAQVLSVSQDDNQQYCTCDACSAIHTEEGSPAATMIRFVNAVAAYFPDKTISTLAYQYTRKPCKTPPADNVLITLCSIECDRSGPIAEKCTEFSQDLIGWGKLTDNIRIWDYTTQFTNFLAPFPNLHTLQPNVQLFRDNHARWVFEQHSSQPSELFELRSYMLAKLLWNPDLNVDSLMTVFTDGYYEEAGVYVKQYVDRIHAELQQDEGFFLFLYGDPSEAFDAYLSADLLQQYSAWFDAAEQAVAHKPAVLSRVQKARLGVDFAVLEACRKNLSATYTLLVHDDSGKPVANPMVGNLLESFYQTCQEHDITLMNEMRFAVSEYYQNYQAALQVAMRPNIARGKSVVSLTQPKKYANEDPMVLTDGALGGSSFYANWLGYEGNDLEVVLDLGEAMETHSISMAYLQVTNHIVFLPEKVEYFSSLDGEQFTRLGTVPSPFPLTKASKVNDIRYYDLTYAPQPMRYIKVKAHNTETPYWHHAAGLPSWVFADEVIVE